MAKLKLKILDNIIWVIFLFLIVVDATIIPRFFTYGNLINILYHSSALGFLVIAESLCLITGNFDLSIESTVGFAPAIGVLMMVKWVPGLNPLLAIIITLLVGSFIGLLNGVLIAKFNMNPFLQTLSFLIIFRGLTYKLIPISIFNLPSQFTFLGGQRTYLNIPIAVLVMLLCVFLVHIMLTKSIYGRSLTAIGGNERASFISGIDIKKVKIIVFIISGTLAAFAGILMVGRQQAVTNAMGEGLVFMAFAGAVMGGVNLQGGVGTGLGMLGGVLVLGVIDNSLTMLGVDAFMVYATKGILIFIAIILDNSKTTLREGILFKEELKRLGRHNGNS
jgi:ribose/xylose/arabinose/galactoside ABC-type transport system permease subunit